MDGLPSDVKQWTFASRADVQANRATCGGDANALIGHASPAVYFLTNGSRIYVGKAINVRKRWHQHMGYKGGGGTTTKGMRASAEHQRLWLVAVVTGFETPKQALQFEFRCHKFNRRLARGLSYDEQVASNILMACRSAPRKARYMQVLYRVLSINKWTTLAVEANTVPLTVNWFDPRYQPTRAHSPEFAYLLPHVSERVVTLDEKQFIYFFRPGEKREQTAKVSTGKRRTKTKKARKQQQRQPEPIPMPMPEIGISSEEGDILNSVEEEEEVVVILPRKRRRPARGVTTEAAAAAATAAVASSSETVILAAAVQQNERQISKTPPEDDDSEL